MQQWMTAETLTAVDAKALAKVASWSEQTNRIHLEAMCRNTRPTASDSKTTNRLQEMAKVLLKVNLINEARGGKSCGSPQGFLILEF